MDYFLNFFNKQLLPGISWGILFSSLCAIIVGFLANKLATMIFKRLTKLSKKTRVKIDEILLLAFSKPFEWALGLGGIFIALHILPIPEEPINIAKFVGALLMATIVSLVIWFTVRLTDGLCGWWAEKAKKTDTKLDDQLVPIVRQSLKVFLYIIGVLFILQNLGYSILSLMAGFGLGGAALAIASKDTVANLFGSIVIFFDKPFQIGDWIEMGDLEGTVEDVGLRTIRVRTFANSLVTVPNARFTTSTVNNWSKMKKRRVKMNIGISYSAAPEKIEELVLNIRKIISEDENFHHDFYLVNFNNFGPYSLDIFIYCFTRTTKWAEYLQARQEFMLKIMQAVSDLGLEFAFPTRTVYLENSGKEV